MVSMLSTVEDADILFFELVAVTDTEMFDVPARFGERTHSQRETRPFLLVRCHIANIKRRGTDRRSKSCVTAVRSCLCYVEAEKNVFCVIKGLRAIVQRGPK
jgi:hypothetical protein